MARYNTGTVSIVTNSTTLTGSGTAWTTSVAAGWFISINTDSHWYQVSSVNSDTSITLCTTFSGTTGSGYVYDAESNLPSSMSVVSGLRNGSGAPSSSVGILGDMYIDTTNKLLYGPKNVNGWGGSIQLGITTILSSAIVDSTSAGRTLLTSASAANQLTILGGAPLASPALSGTPTAPTATAGTNTTQIATTAYVKQSIATTLQGNRNRLFNGAMIIDQHHNGSSVVLGSGGTYVVDGWAYTASQASKFSASQYYTASTSTGFNYSLGLTVISSYSVASSDYHFICQPVEGFKITDFSYGTSNAQTTTLSFWVNTSVTGTHSGSIRNYAGSRSYPFSFSIPVAGTLTYITVTIPGDTGGTWAQGAAGAAYVSFNLGSGATYTGTPGAWTTGDYVGATGSVSVVGSPSAYLYITGVQWELGSTATVYEYRPYVTELAFCERYFQTSYDIGTAIGSVAASSYYRTIEATNNYPSITIPLRTPMRSITGMGVTIYSPGTGATGKIYDTSTTTDINAVVAYYSTKAVSVQANNVSVSAGHGISVHVAVSSEL